MTNYKIYPSLLDQWLDYQGSVEYGEPAEVAKKKIIDYINRVPIEPTELMMKGRDFESLVVNPSFVTKFEFDPSVVAEVRRLVNGALHNVFTQGVIETDYGDVNLYGYVDFIKGDIAMDTKFVGNYDIGKYYNSAQRLVYPYCLRFGGTEINQFQFVVATANNVFVESYEYTDFKGSYLRPVITSFLRFVEENRELITDKKLFYLE